MERLDKLLASTGRWSRREAKALIQAGRVLVDGMPARRGEDKADPSVSRILVDGEVLDWLSEGAGGGVRERVQLLSADPDAEYCKVLTYDVTDLVPLASCPDAPACLKMRVWTRK